MLVKVRKKIPVFQGNLLVTTAQGSSTGLKTEDSRFNPGVNSNFWMFGRRQRSVSLLSSRACFAEE